MSAQDNNTINNTDNDNNAGTEAQAQAPAMVFPGQEEGLVTGRQQKFNFKSRKIVDEDGKVLGRTKKQDAITATLPVLTAAGIIGYLQQDAESNVSKMIVDAVGRIVVEAARDQLDEVVESFGDDESKIITVGALDYDKLNIEYLASLPPSSRGVTPISDEEWEGFFSDYLAVMVQATGKEEKRIKAHIDLFKKPQRARSQKDVLKVLVDQLDIYLASSESLEETGEAASRIRTKMEKWLNEPEKQMNVDLL